VVLINPQRHSPHLNWRSLWGLVVDQDFYGQCALLALNAVVYQRRVHLPLPNAIPPQSMHCLASHRSRRIRSWSGLPFMSLKRTGLCARRTAVLPYPRRPTWRACCATDCAPVSSATSGRVNVRRRQLQVQPTLSVPRLYFHCLLRRTSKTPARVLVQPCPADRGLQRSEPAHPYGSGSNCSATGLVSGVGRVHSGGRCSASNPVLWRRRRRRVT
jgi:hypothetical protein